MFWWKQPRVLYWFGKVDLTCWLLYFRKTCFQRMLYSLSRMSFAFKQLLKFHFVWVLEAWNWFGDLPMFFCLSSLRPSKTRDVPRKWLKFDPDQWHGIYGAGKNTQIQEQIAAVTWNRTVKTSFLEYILYIYTRTLHIYIIYSIYIYYIIYSYIYSELQKLETSDVFPSSPGRTEGHWGDPTQLRPRIHQWIGSGNIENGNHRFFPWNLGVSWIFSQPIHWECVWIMKGRCIYIYM
jgi:hypothetical protein